MVDQEQEREDAQVRLLIYGGLVLLLAAALAWVFARQLAELWDENLTGWGKDREKYGW
jgi:hypothetical protein